MRKTFRYRIYPTVEQEARLLAWQDACRFLWNLAHEQRLIGLRRTDERYYTAYDQMLDLTVIRAEEPWLSELPRHVCEGVLVELDRAWQRCFNKLAWRPRWRRKTAAAQPGLCEHDPRCFRVELGGIVFPKLGLVRAVLHRPIEGKPKTCTLVRDVDEWYACVSCEVPDVEVSPPAGHPVGIDRGAVNLLADSDGRIVAAPRSLRRVEERLARAQGELARKRKGSNNRKKARRKVARIHRKACRQRDAVLHRESAYYAKKHSVVVIERLNLRGMTASAKGTVEDPGTQVRQKAGLNRSLLDAALGKLGSMLAYKTSWYGSRLVDVRAAYSSQECSACGHVAAASRQGQSKFECVACGHRLHADVNAAKVVLGRGTHGGAVCGGSGAGHPVKQKLRVARRGARV